MLVQLTAQAQLLYKISGGSLTEPSYIVGTCHTAAISFVDYIPGLRRAMNAAQQVYGETKMDAKSAPTTEELDKFMLLPKGMTLDSLLTADEMKPLHLIFLCAVMALTTGCTGKKTKPLNYH